MAKTYSSWTMTSTDSDGIETKVAIGVEWYVSGGHGDAYVYTRIDGKEELAKGEMKIERVLREGPGERLSEPITKVEVRSIGGDVIGTGRSMKDAAEDYASKVARIRLDRLARFKHAYVHPGPQDCKSYAECHARAYGLDAPAGAGDAVEASRG